MLILVSYINIELLCIISIQFDAVSLNICFSASYAIKNWIGWQFANLEKRNFAIWASIVSSAVEPLIVLIVFATMVKAKINPSNFIGCSDS